MNTGDFTEGNGGNEGLPEIEALKLPSKWKVAADELPDSDCTVLGYHPEWSEPVWPVYHDGEGWCDVDGMSFEARPNPPPTHWMDFPEPPKP